MMASPAGEAPSKEEATKTSEGSPEAEDKATRDYSEYPREIKAPEGLPEGWKCIEHVYMTGDRKGVPYLRYTSPVGKPHYLSVKAAVVEQAKANGEDEQVALQKYEQKKLEKAEQQAKEREEHGKAKGEHREAAVNIFRETFGPLTGTDVELLPGWSCQLHCLPKCGQVFRKYFDPQGNVYTLLVDIECKYGLMLLNGDEEAARAAVTHKASANERDRMEKKRHDLYEEKLKECKKLYLEDRARRREAGEEVSDDEPPEGRRKRPRPLEEGQQTLFSLFGGFNKKPREQEQDQKEVKENDKRSAETEKPAPQSEPPQKSAEKPARKTPASSETQKVAKNTAPQTSPEKLAKKTPAEATPEKRIVSIDTPTPAKALASAPAAAACTTSPSPLVLKATSQSCACGALYLEQSKFCISCGSERPKFCHSCGSQYMHGKSKFCHRCGEKKLE